MSFWRKGHVMRERVLLVDDDVMLLRSLGRSLDEDFDFELAESGAIALEKIEAVGPFKVVVSDLKMPRMNGIELVKRIKEKYPRVVCMILTGNQDEDSISLAQNVAKADRLLHKPIPRAELVQAIQEAIQQFDTSLVSNA